MTMQLLMRSRGAATRTGGNAGLRTVAATTTRMQAAIGGSLRSATIRRAA
jgi:hypothetical protein